MSLQPHKDFHFLFNKKEGKELMGKNYSNFLILLIILSITFIVIGFSTGSIYYLKSKMEDPFINSLNVEIPWGLRSDTVKNRIQRMKIDQAAKKRFSYQNITEYNRYTLYMIFFDKDSVRPIYGRTIDIRNPLINIIFEDKNLLSKEGRKFRDSIDAGIVVTGKLLQKLNYPENAIFINLGISTDSGYAKAPVPIIAVVKELPGMNMFLTTAFFRDQRKTAMSSGKNPFNPYDMHPLSLFCFLKNEDEKVAGELRNAIDTYFKKDIYKKWDPYTETTPREDSSSYKKGYKIKVDFEKDSLGNKLYPIELNHIFKKLINSSELSGFDKNEIFQIYEYSFHDEYDEEDKGDYFTINFSSLDNVKGFKECLLSSYYLEVDMENIETRNNYYLIATLTEIISFIMVIFSILSINIFITNVLIKHLEKIIKNIGTLKAFGLDNLTLKQIYLNLSMKHIFMAIGISLFFAGIFGYPGGMKLILQYFTELDEKQKYFDLIGWPFLPSLISIVSITGITYITLTRVIKKILNRTPGDLIYERK